LTARRVAAIVETGRRWTSSRHDAAVAGGSGKRRVTIGTTLSVTILDHRTKAQSPKEGTGAFFSWSFS
jgi:hypothetical protein